MLQGVELVQRELHGGPRQARRESDRGGRGALRPERARGGRADRKTSGAGEHGGAGATSRDTGSGIGCSGRRGWWSRSSEGAGGQSAVKRTGRAPRTSPGPPHERTRWEGDRDRPRDHELLRRRHGGRRAAGHPERRGLAHHALDGRVHRPAASSSSARSPSARPSPTRSRTVFARKRLIGRRFDSDEVRRFKRDRRPSASRPRENGDAWVRARRPAAARRRRSPRSCSRR